MSIIEQFINHCTAKQLDKAKSIYEGNCDLLNEVAVYDRVALSILDYGPYGSDDMLPVLQWVESLTDPVIMKNINIFQQFYDACFAGRFKCCQWLLTKNPNFPEDNFNISWFEAVCHGPLDDQPFVAMLYTRFQKHIDRVLENKDCERALFKGVGQNNNGRITVWILTNMKYTLDAIYVLFKYAVLSLNIDLAQYVYYFNTDWQKNIRQFIETYGDLDALVYRLLTDSSSIQGEKILQWLDSIMNLSRLSIQCLISLEKKASLHKISFLFNAGKPMHTMVDSLFCDACEHGVLAIAKWIVSIKPSINVSMNHEQPFINSISNGHIHMANWLLKQKPTINISAHEEEAFCNVCKSGNLGAAQWLYALKPDINVSIANETPFRIACENGHLHVAQWLLHVKPTIDMSSHFEYAFLHAVRNNHYQVVKWLLETKPTIDVRINDDEAFKTACEQRSIRILRFLAQIRDCYRIDIVVDNFAQRFNEEEDIGVITYWYIYEKKQLPCLNTLIQTDGIYHECCVCWEASNAKLQCGHYVCQGCLKNLQTMKCPYCRAEFTGYISVITREE